MEVKMKYHKDSEKKHHHLEIKAMGHGGFLIYQGKFSEGDAFDGRYHGWREFLAAFSTLPEALEWVGRNTAEPAKVVVAK
jgi:hypothetical protein